MLCRSGDQEVFQSAFDELLSVVQTAVFRELALTPCGDDALDRVGRIEAAITPDDIDASPEWLESLPPAQMEAILQGLAGR